MKDEFGGVKAIYFMLSFFFFFQRVITIINY